MNTNENLKTEIIDIKRSLNIYDPSFFALSLYCFVEGMVKNYLISEKKYVSSDGKDQGLSAVLKSLRKVLEKKRREPELVKLINDIKKNSNQINELRHRFSSLTPEIALSLCSSPLNFIKYFMRVSKKDIDEIAYNEVTKEIERRRTKPEYLEQIRSYYSSNLTNIQSISELFEKYDNIYKSLEQKEDEINNLLEQKEDEINNLKDSLNEQKKENHELEKKLDDITEQSKKRDNKNDTLRQKLYEKKKDIKALDDKISSLTENVKKLKDQLDKIPMTPEEFSFLREMVNYSVERRIFEKKIMRLSPRQEQIIEEVDFTQNVFITGVAGTGKTLILLKLMEKLLLKDKNTKCLFFTYTNNLINYAKYIFPSINENVSNLCNDKLETLDGFFYKNTHKQLREIHDDDIWIEGFSTIASYDYIFVDEIQDFSTFELKLIKSWARKGLIFAGDFNQTIYDKKGSLRDAGIVDYKQYTLDRDFRSTIPLNSLAERYKQFVVENNIATTCKDISPSSNNIVCFRPGLPVKAYRVKDPILDTVERVKQIVDLEDYEKDSICVITYTKEAAENIKKGLKNKKKIPVSYFRENNNKSFDFDKPGVKVTTISSAKGLEFPYVVFCANMSSSSHTDQYRLIYTTITRASDMLEVFAPLPDKKGKENEAVKTLLSLILNEES